MKASDLFLAIQALRLVTSTVADYRRTGTMDAEALVQEWERISARSREVAADLDAALDEADAADRDDQPA